MALPPRWTLVTVCVLAAISNIVSAAGFVDAHGKPAPAKCVEGEEYFLSSFIFECRNKKFEFFGCFVNNVRYKSNETKDTDNIRLQYCVKKGNSVRSGAIGCVTDDGIFLDNNATLIQKDNVTFTCVKLKEHAFSYQKSSGGLTSCEQGAHPIIVNNLQYVCNDVTQRYQARACVAFGDHSKIIAINETFDDEYYRYKCVRNNSEIVFHAVNCFDNNKNVITPGTEKFSGNKLYKCLHKNEDDLSLVIAETGGCANPKNKKLLRVGSVLRKSRRLTNLRYKITYKCVQIDQNETQSFFEWKPIGIEINGKQYTENDEIIIIGNLKYQIISSGANDIRLIAFHDSTTVPPPVSRIQTILTTKPNTVVPAKTSVKTTKKHSRTTTSDGEIYVTFTTPKNQHGPSTQSQFTHETIKPTIKNAVTSVHDKQKLTNVCENGTKVQQGQIMYICYQGKMVYYGCIINGQTHRQGEIVDKNSLRSKYCVKKGNRITSTVLGCITDDGIFLEGYQNVTQSDGNIFACVPHFVNGKKIGYNYTKSSPPKVISACHIGQRKVLRNIYVMECRSSKAVIGGFEYALKGCLTKPGDLSTILLVNSTHDERFDDNDFGFQYSCAIRKHDKNAPTVYSYEAVACLAEKKLIYPGQTYKSGSLTVMCYRDGQYLRLKPVYAGLSTAICKDNSVFYLGNFKYQCETNKERSAIACLSFNNNTEVKIGDYYDNAFTYRYQCRLDGKSGVISFVKTHCLDENNQPMEPGSKKLLNDESMILCRRDHITNELARVSVSGRLLKCKLGKDNIFIKNYIAYKCSKSIIDKIGGEYRPVGCAPDNDVSKIIGFGEFYDSQFYRYICERKDKFTIIYRAAVCLDGFGHIIRPQFRERAGDDILKCNQKKDGNLEFKILNPYGCRNPFKNNTLLKLGNVITELGKIHDVTYEKRFKCIRVGVYFELVADSIIYKGQRYQRPGQVIISKNGGKLIIVQTADGGYSIQYRSNDQLRCYYNHKVYENGCKFVTPSENTIYRCVNGDIVKIGCKIGKSYIRVGTTVEIAKETYQCPVASEGYIKIPISECQLQNGTILPFGHSFIDNNIVYRCSYQGSGSEYSSAIIAVGCIMNDKVIPINGFREVFDGKKHFFVCRLGYEDGPTVTESSDIEADCINAKGKVDCFDEIEYGEYHNTKGISGSSSESSVMEVGGINEGDDSYLLPDTTLGHGDNINVGLVTLPIDIDAGIGTDRMFTIPGLDKASTLPGFSDWTEGSIGGVTKNIPSVSNKVTTGKSDSTDVFTVVPTIYCNETTVTPVTKSVTKTTVKEIETTKRFTTFDVTTETTDTTSTEFPFFPLDIYEDYGDDYVTSNESVRTNSSNDFTTNTQNNTIDVIPTIDDSTTLSSDSTPAVDPTREESTDYFSSTKKQPPKRFSIINTVPTRIPVITVTDPEDGNIQINSRNMSVTAPVPIGSNLVTNGGTGFSSNISFEVKTTADVHTSSKVISTESVTVSESSTTPFFAVDPTIPEVSESMVSETRNYETSTKFSTLISNKTTGSNGGITDAVRVTSFGFTSDVTKASTVTKIKTTNEGTVSTTESSVTPSTAETEVTDFTDYSTSLSSTIDTSGGTVKVVSPISERKVVTMIPWTDLMNKTGNFNRAEFNISKPSESTFTFPETNTTLPNVSSNSTEKPAVGTSEVVTDVTDVAFSLSTIDSRTSNGKTRITKHEFESSTIATTNEFETSVQTTNGFNPDTTTHDVYSTSSDETTDEILTLPTKSSIREFGGNNKTNNLNTTEKHDATTENPTVFEWTTSTFDENTLSSESSTDATMTTNFDGTSISGVVTESSETPEASVSTPTVLPKRHATGVTILRDGVVVTTRRVPKNISSLLLSTTNSGFESSTDAEFISTTTLQSTTSDDTEISFDPKFFGDTTVLTTTTDSSGITEFSSTEGHQLKTTLRNNGENKFNGFDERKGKERLNNGTNNTNETFPTKNPLSISSTSDGSYTISSTNEFTQSTQKSVTENETIGYNETTHCKDLLQSSVCLRFLPLCAPYALKRNIALTLHHNNGQNNNLVTKEDLSEVENIKTVTQFDKFVEKMAQKAVINNATLKLLQKHAGAIVSKPKSLKNNEQCDGFKLRCYEGNDEQACLLHHAYCYTDAHTTCMTPNSCQKSVNYYRYETAELLTRLCPVTCGLQTCRTVKSQIYDENEIDDSINALRSCH